MNSWQQCWKQVIVLAALCAALPGGFAGPAMNTACAATDFQWTWMNGTSGNNQPGAYGAILTPSAGNVPGGREGACSWTDPSGALWMYGGWGYDSTGNTRYLNDLWKYDRLTGNWAWMKGASTGNQAGVYGSPLTPAPGNNPGSRMYAASWTDPSGALWLFGGYGYDSTGSPSYLSDLWKYDRSSGNWTWMKGPNTAFQPGTYGTIATPATLNNPGARQNPTSWTDSSGALWLFGGQGLDSTANSDILNDLWKFNPATGDWTWMKGANTVNHWGVYGTMFTPAADNTPGARYFAVSWTDPSGSLWLFGGYGRDSTGAAGCLNDLWNFNPDSGNWTWMKGPDTSNHSGVYGLPGTPAPENTPGGRYETVAFTDALGALWLFGGYAIDNSQSLNRLNDLWKYDRTSGNWACMKGASSANQGGTYGTPGTPNPANTPGARSLAVSWTDSSGALWLFGGNGYDKGNSLGRLNDLWRWQDAIRPTGTIVINSNQSVTNNPNTTLSLTWSDGVNDGSGVTRMRFSNDGGTWSTWESLAATKAWTLSTGEGYKTVRVMYRDRAGNNSTAYSDYIRMDTMPPIGTILINNGASTTNTPVVSLGLTWSDGTGSGVTRMRFSIDGATWTAWEALAPTRAYTLPATPGYYTVRVTYRDAAGNISAPFNDYIKLLAP